MAGRAYHGLNDQQWEQEVSRIQRKIGDIVNGWYQTSDVQPAETWVESIKELNRRLDELQRESSDWGS